MIRLGPAGTLPAVVSDPRSTHREWTLSDFLFVVFSGYVTVFLTAVALTLVAEPAVVAVGSLVGQYTGHLLGLWVVIRRRHATFGALGLHVVPSDGIYIFGGMILQFLIAFASIPLARLLEVDGSAQSLTEQITSIQGPALQASLLLSVALLAPVTEELMFRGLLPKIVERRVGTGAAIIVAALVFALFHLLGISLEGFWSKAALVLPQLFLVGLVLGWQASRRRRLGVAIFIHSGINLVAILALLVAPETFS